MDGGYFVIGECIVCKRPFTFHPLLVPSHPARGGQPSTDPKDPREPICRSCIEVINAEREKHGRPTWPIPHGAYEVAEGFPP